MQHYQSSPSSHLVATSIDGSNTYPRDLKSHTRNAEEWNDFHQKSGIRDQGKREFSHREYGNKKHDKVTEERHLEGPSSKADQWRQHEYFESHKPNGSTRILRNEHALNEHKEDCSPDGTRRVYSHSSTVHVSSHMTTKHNSNIKTGEALTDFASFESPLPLDHSPQKGKGNLGKQGALNQRRRPSKGSLKVNVSSEDDFTDNNENEFSSNVRETLSSEVQRQNVENSRRSHYVNHQSSHVTSSSTSKLKNTSKSSAPQKSPEWLKELKERNTKRSQTSSPVTVHSSSRIDGIERNLKQSETSTYRKPPGSRDNNTVLVVNSGTWTKAKKSDSPSRDHDPLTSRKEHGGSNVKVTPNKEVHFGDSDGEDGQIASHRQGKFSHLEESVATTFTANNSINTSVTLTADQNSNQPKRNQHPGRIPRDASPSLQEKKQTKSISKPKSQSSPNSVILVEGPTTKLVTSFSYQTKTTKTTNQGTTSNQYQQFGTFDKKELSQNSSSGFITINGDHPPIYATKNQHQPSGSSPRSTHQLDKTNVEVTKREVSSRREAIHLQEPPSQHKKVSVEKSAEFGDNRAIIMNEIRKFDPRNLRKQMELHRTNLWVSRSTEDDDRYGYSQSDMVFDDDRDSGGWSPRVLSPSAYRASSPRAISPDLHRTYSEPLLQPPWVQVANERQMKFYDWESIEERRNRESYSEAPWQEESIRKSESIRNLMTDYSKDNKDGEINNGVMSLDRHFGKIDSQESVNSWEWVETRDKTKSRPEWVEIAKQRQRMRNEMQEIDETISKHSSAFTAPSWRTEIKLRETPGIPVLDSSSSPSPDGYKNEYRPKARPQAKPFPIDTFQTPVKVEWLKNVRLKKTSHLTKVKGPEVGRVLDDDERQTKVQPSSGIESKYNYFSSPTKSVSDTGRVSPISRHVPKRRNQSEITVDHVLSSIRLIRQASLSTSDLSDLKNKSQVSPFLPPSKAESMYLTSSPTPQFYPRTSSPSGDYSELKTSTESEKPVFHPTPQWILDLKLRKQQRRVQPLNSRKNEERDVDSEIPQHDAADYRNTPSSKKSSTWSASTSRRQFRNVLNEIKNMGHEETPESIQRTPNYGPRLHSVDRQDRPLITKEEEIYHQHKLEMLVSRDNRSPSPTHRSVSPTLSSKDNDESGVCNEPLTWWIQIPSSSQQPDSKQQQKKFQTFLNKKSSSPSQFSARTRQSTTIQKHIPENTKRQNLSPLGKRSPSPSDSKFTSRTKDQSGTVTSRKVTQTIDKKSSAASSPVGRSPSTSPTRKPSSTSARGRSPISTSRGRSPQASPKGRSPQASPSGRSPQTSSSGPSSPTAGGQVPSKVKASPQRGAAKPKTTSPKSTAKSPTTPKRTPVNSSPTSPRTKTEITVGVSRNSNVSVETTNKFTPSNARSPSPDLTKKWNASPKSFVTTPKSSVNRAQSSAIDRNRTASKSTTAVSQSTSIQITSTHSTVVNSQKSSPTSSTPSPPPGKEFLHSSSSPPATRGRFSQLLSDLSKTNIQRSHSLKGDDSYSASIGRDKHTFPLRFQESASSFLDSAELVRQVSSSSRSLNIRKPRVRFSSTEIVWPLDLEGHSPVTTCHHPVQATD